MKKISALFLMSLLLCVLNGCTESASRYIYDRFADAADIGTLSLGVGSIGISADVQATSYFRAGFGSYQAQNKIGKQGRKAGFWVENKSILAFGSVYQYYYRQKNIIGNIQDTNVDLIKYLSGAPGRNKLSPTWLIDVNLYAVIVGLEIGIDPVEVFDFVFGFLTIDIANDDILRRPDPAKSYLNKLRETGYGKKSELRPDVPSFNKGISPVPDSPYRKREATVNSNSFRPVIQSKPRPEADPFKDKREQFFSTHGGGSRKPGWQGAALDF